MIFSACGNVYLASAVTGKVAPGTRRVCMDELVFTFILPCAYLGRNCNCTTVP